MTMTLDLSERREIYELINKIFWSGFNSKWNCYNKVDWPNLT